jgi:hypothetical protein
VAAGVVILALAAQEVLAAVVRVDVF